MQFLTPATKRFILYSVAAFSTGVFLLLSAIVSYCILYRLYLPTSAQSSMLVNFDYNLIQAYDQYHGALAIMPFGPNTVVNEKYEMRLELTFPRYYYQQRWKNQSAKSHGNFIVYTLFTNDINKDFLNLPSRMHPKERFVRDSSYSVRTLALPMRDSILSMIDTVVFAPLYLLGLKTQSDTISTDLASIPSSNFKAVMIELDSDVTVESATLHWRPKWSGIRYIMAHHPIISFIFGVAAFWSIETCVTCIVALILITIFSPDSSRNQGIDDTYRIPSPTLSENSHEKVEKQEDHQRPTLKSSPKALPQKRHLGQLGTLDSLGPDPLYPNTTKGDIDSGPGGPELTPAPSPLPSSSLDATIDTSDDESPPGSSTPDASIISSLQRPTPTSATTAVSTTAAEDDFSRRSLSPK